MVKSDRCGWESDFPVFKSTQYGTILDSLKSFISDASPEQIHAWDDSVPKLQKEAAEVLAADRQADTFCSILEYELPMESRRPDVVLLINGAVVVLECKGKQQPSQADIDQVAAYARDLKCYHKECENRPVYAVLVPSRARNTIRGRMGFVTVNAVMEEFECPFISVNGFGLKKERRTF